MINLMPDDSAALSTALTCFKAGDLPAAENHCRAALTEDRNDCEALHLLGVIAHRAGRNEIAIKHVRLTIEVDSGKAAYFTTLGFGCASKGVIATPLRRWSGR